MDKGIIAVIALIALIASYAWGRYDGGKINEVIWQKREAEINAASAAKIKLAEDNVLTAERHGAEALAKASEEYQNELRKTKLQKDAVIADLRSHNRKLSIPATCPPAGGNSASAAVSPSSRRNGATRAELSDTAAEFLVSLAGEADEVVKQLTAAQKVILEDRKTCGRP